MENQQKYSNGKKNNSNIFLWGALGLLLIAGTYLFISKKKVSDNLENTEHRLTDVSESREELTNEYNAAQARLDQLRTENVAMDSLIKFKESEIGSMGARIERILKNKEATTAELSQAREMITELEGLIDGFRSQITALKSENIELSNDKKNLIEENKAANNTIQEVTKQKQAVQKEQETSIKKIAKVTEEKVAVEKDLENTKDLGSVLTATQINMNVINKKKNLLGKEVQKETGKARKADLLEINFDLGVNRVSESGQKEIYISVFDPSGNIIHSSGNAASINLAEGGSREYTTVKSVPYTKGQKTYDIKHKCVPTDRFSSGVYSVELYHKGYLIGKDNITLK